MIQRPADKKRTALVPRNLSLRDGTEVVLDYIRDEQIEHATQLFNNEIGQGNTYPQDFEHTADQFRAYFCSHDCFVLSSPADPARVLGMFYVKPNYPGRFSSSHLLIS